MRIDIFLVEKFKLSREKAQHLIKEGKVLINNKIAVKNSMLVKENDKIELKEEKIYVSRGAYKLEGATKSFNINFKDKNILDIGASTGGFSQFALEQGANFIYAIDVGTNQLDISLKNNEKIKSIENINIKELKLDKVELADIVLVDLSFISLVNLFVHFRKFLKKDGLLITLIKPQFELGSKIIGKKGIANISLHQKAIDKVIENAISQKFFLNNFSVSCIKGTKGNIEYFALFSFFDNKFKYNFKNYLLK